MSKLKGTFTIDGDIISINNKTVARNMLNEFREMYTDGDIKRAYAEISGKDAYGFNLVALEVEIYDLLEWSDDLRDRQFVISFLLVGCHEIRRIQLWVDGALNKNKYCCFPVVESVYKITL